VSDVVRGRSVAVDPARFSPDLPDDAVVVEATVTDVRTAPDLLVEIGDGEETIWVSGFDKAPARASTVLTGLLGGPEPHETLGSVYPSSGSLDPDDVVHGFTERGALAVLVGIGLGLVLVGPLAEPLSRRVRARRTCPDCRRRLGAEWRTCAWCGRAQELPQGAEPETTAELASVPVPPPEAASPPVERPTRIVPGD
jgi:hypothetical protein